SRNQVIPPILTSFFVAAALLVFLPWLAIYLLKRKSNEFGIISNKAKLPYITGAELVADNITLAKGNYSITQYASSYNLAQEAEESARLYLRLFLIQLKSISELLRTLLIIGIVTLVSAMIFYLNRRRIIEVAHQEVFSKDQLIPQLLGMLSAISICIIITAIFGFKFAATSFNSRNQVIPPILTSFFVAAALLVFLPWLAIYLLKRKSNEFVLCFSSLYRYLDMFCIT
ncbi:MAG: hypothetical protein ACTSR6_07395, partial [Candidatus Heimdallarchaeota archaeon]